MSPNDPRHGTNAGAVQHWRDGETACAPCLRGHRLQSKAATLDRHRGNPRTVALGNHAHAIVANTARDQLARATGLTVHKLSRLDKAGPTAVVHRSTRDRILTAGQRHYWTPAGIQRRLRALYAVGWSMRALAPQVGMHETVLRQILHREHPRFIRHDVAARILAAYERRCMDPRTGAGATRARNTAAANDWAPPLAWDDIDHDPAPKGYVATTDALDDVAIDRRIAGDRVPLTTAEKAEARRRWVATGRPLNELERVTGINTHRRYEEAS